MKAPPPLDKETPRGGPGRDEDTGDKIRGFVFFAPACCVYCSRFVSELSEMYLEQALGRSQKMGDFADNLGLVRMGWIWIG